MFRRAVAWRSRSRFLERTSSHTARSKSALWHFGTRP
jgi:hypothetical protein